MGAIAFSWDEPPDKIRRRMRLRRVWRRFAAVAGGYFWLPCPRCGTEFGGQEWADLGRFQLTTEMTESSRTSQGVCTACEVELGQMGRPLCERHGHTPLPVWIGGMIGPNEASVSFGGDIPPTVIYCSTCGVDLPTT